MNISWARLASFRHLGFISDPLIVSKVHNETHDPKGQEDKIYTIVKGRETFYRRHTVQVTSYSEVKYVLKRESAFLDLHLFISNDIVCTKINDKCHNFDFKIVSEGHGDVLRRHTVPVTSCSEVKYVLKRVSVGTKDSTKELKLECAYFVGQTS